MFEIKAINAFSDNFIWCIINNNSQCVLVDPGDANVCIEFIEKNQLHLTDILITHHHSDHVGGLAQLIDFAKTQDSAITVYGPASENISLLDHKLVEGNRITLFDDQLEFAVIDLPGHTSGHIAFYNESENALFCGDTLFSGGCGRLFEGTPAQMFQSLKKLAALPDETEIYCAHEYTSSNLAFALVAEQDNPHLQRYREDVSRMRAQGISTIPSTLRQEKLVNPFLRCEQLSIKKSVADKAFDDSDLETFAALRRWKDNF